MGYTYEGTVEEEGQRAVSHQLSKLVYVINTLHLLDDGDILGDLVGDVLGDADGDEVGITVGANSGIEKRRGG